MAELQGTERRAYRQKTFTFDGDSIGLPGRAGTPPELASAATVEHTEFLDAVDIKGNELAKRQLLVAAAGRHLVTLRGPENERAEFEKLLHAFCLSESEEFHIVITLEEPTARERESKLPGTSSKLIQSEIENASDLRLDRSLDPLAETLLHRSTEYGFISEQTQIDVISVANTIAALDHSSTIKAEHITEAINYAPRPASNFEPTDSSSPPSDLRCDPGVNNTNHLGEQMTLHKTTSTDNNSQPTTTLICPDRQQTFGDLPHYEWPTPKHDRDTITVDRIRDDIDGPSHRFVIRRGDTVEVFFSKDKLEIGEVVGISHAREEVRVRFGERGQGIWFAVGQIYPTLPQEKKPRGGTKLSQIIESSSSEPAGGFSEADKVPQTSTSPDIQALKKRLMEKLMEEPGTEFTDRDLRIELGYADFDPKSPLLNPVHLALKELRDSGRIHVAEPTWGDPRISVLAFPQTPDQFATWACPDILLGPEVSHLMQQHSVTIEKLSARMQITQKRIRHIRDRGLEGRNAVRDWAEAITKQDPENGVFTLDDHKQFRGRMKRGETTATELQADFERMLASRSEMLAELQKRYNAKELQNLAGNLGNCGAGRNSKYENAQACYRSLLQMFHLSDSFRFDPMRESLEDAIARCVRALTEADLEQFFERRGLAGEAHKKSLENPETLAEFHTFIRHRGVDELSDQWLARYDALEADITRDRRAANTATTVGQVDTQDTEGLELTIKEGYHDKRSCPLWIVQLSCRVERDTYKELNQKAKMLGGWYSSFKKADAGFHFLDEDAARKFARVLHGDVDRTEELEARRQRKEEGAAERLTRLANEMHGRAEQVIEYSREHALKNTVRRSEMQAGIRGRAYADQALARTATSIAGALETGNAKYLDGIRAFTHIELFQRILRRARTDHNQARNRKAEQEGNPVPFHERENYREREPNETDIRFAKYPYVTIYKRHIEEALAETSRARGVKQASAKMRKRIRAEKEDYVTFKEDYDTSALTDWLTRVRDAGHRTDWMDREVSDYKRCRAAGLFTIHELRSALRELLPHLGTSRGDDPVMIAEQELIGKQLPGFFSDTPCNHRGAPRPSRHSAPPPRT